MKQVAKFISLVREYLVELGGKETDQKNEFRVPTVAGPMSVKICENGTIFGRFDMAWYGTRYGGSKSGKWNHHWGNETCNEAMEVIRRDFGLLRLPTVEQFEDSTGLSLGILFQDVLQEAGHPHFGCSWLSAAEGLEWFEKSCTQRILLCWSNNSWIRTNLDSDSGRDCVAMFFHHWLDAYLDNPVEYRKRNPI